MHKQKGKILIVESLTKPQRLSNTEQGESLTKPQRLGKAAQFHKEMKHFEGDIYIDNN